jgi:DNA mismatch repair ATPase MutS
MGLITTHDLALAQIEEGLGSAAKNVHFDDQIVDGRIEFDYLLREGVVVRSNALELMRAVGLPV